MAKNCGTFQNIELQDFLICDKCNKNHSLKKEDVPIADIISTQNKKENLKGNLSNIYEYDKIQRDDYKNKNFNFCKKCLIFLSIFLILSLINIYIYSSYYQKRNIRNINNNTNKHKKGKNINKRKLVQYGVEIFIKFNESKKDYILNKNFNLEPNKIIIKEKNNDITICENNCTNNLRINAENNIIELIFYLEEIKGTINFDSMFKGCNNIKEINISGINYPIVNSTFQMFMDCNSLSLFNFENISFTDLATMEEMFSNCNSLQYVDFSNQDLGNVISTKHMFENCCSLTSVSFSGADFKNLEIAESVFENCKLLNISEFFKGKLDNLINMKSTFEECSSLKSLNLTGLITKNLNIISYMFSGCTNLETLIFDNSKKENVTSMSGLFNNCKSLISFDLSSFDTKNVQYMDFMLANCSSLENIDLSEFNLKSLYSMTSMFENCINLKNVKMDLINSKATLIDNMFSGCESLTFLELINFDMSSISSIYNFLQGCKKLEYINMNNSASNLNLSISIDPFVDIAENAVICIEQKPFLENIYKYIIDYKTIDCSQNWKNAKKKYFNGKCYDRCPIGTYVEDENNNLCVNYSIPNGLDLNCSAQSFFNNLCSPNINSFEKKAEYINYILDEIKNDSFKNIFEDIIQNNKTFINNDNGITYALSTISNQNFINSSIIYLDECEAELKLKNIIDQNEKLILFKLEYSSDDLKIPVIEYSLFNKDGENINLDLCKEIPVYYSIPVKIEENKEFMYNPNSDFYQDRCFPFKTDDGTDITIYDRKNDFNNKHLSLCEKNCEYKGYDANNKRANCECKIKTEFPSLIKNLNIDKKELLNNFKNFGKNSNLFVISCYKLFFSKEGMSKNICSYLIIIFICKVIASSIFFAYKGYSLYNSKIKDIIYKRFSKIGEKEKEDKKEMKSGPVIYLRNSDKEIQDNKNIIGNISFNKLIDLQNKENNTNNYSDELIFLDNDYEINYSEYNQALEYDKRTFFQYYWSLLKTKHLIIFTFYTKTDYNSRIIKLCLFTFSFSLFFTINALFFDDSSMHQIYIDKGNYNFAFQIPQIIYSTIISSVIKLILNQLSLTEKKIVNLKQAKNLNKDKTIKSTLDLLNCFKKQFIIFFILNIFFLLLFWYYLGCFGAVYKNTQITLIKDTIISFISSLIYPFFIIFIPCFLRFKALNAVNKDKECLYKISVISQLL